MKRCQSYFIILTVHTRNIRNRDRLEWLLYHILSFSQSVHATYETMTDFSQCGACSGSPQLLEAACIMCVDINGVVGPSLYFSSIANHTLRACCTRLVTNNLKIVEHLLGGVQLISLANHDIFIGKNWCNNVVITINSKRGTVIMQYCDSWHWSWQ